MLLADELPENTTAAALLVDNVWAANFAHAIRNANGELLHSVRIPHEVVQAKHQSLLAAAVLE